MTELKNNHILKITGEAELSDMLDIDCDYVMKLGGNVVSINKRSNQNGSYDFVYKIKLLTAEIEAEKGKTIKAISEKSKSQKLRNCLFAIYAGMDVDMEFDPWYQMIMDKWIANAESILEFTKNK